MASVVDTSVKHFGNFMGAAAPVINGVAGSVIAAIDAFAVNGFDLKNATSLVVSGGVATLAFTGSHSARLDTVIVVAGSSVAALNGEQKVTAVEAGIVRFATAAPDGAAGGAITFKMAPLGFVKTFTGVNLATFKPSSPQASGFTLRVDDALANYAQVRGYEQMSDVNTGLKQFPPVALVTSQTWGKSDAASAAARNWWAFGDSRGFYLCIAPSANQALNSQCFYFGDLNAYKSGDAFACVLNAFPGLTPHTTGSTVNGCVGVSSRGTTAGGVARASNGVGGGQLNYSVGSAGFGTDVYSGGTGYGLGTYPNQADNSLMTHKLLSYQSVNSAFRGSYPGLLHLQQSGASNAFAPGDIVDGTGALAGRRLLAVRVGPPATAAAGVVFFDITGGWRD
ncbi:hypothetical protein ABID97_002757 [Variovorax sp. OAS795]|uniref:hypothetical protein n=1 Tax=Variovorax sp. OAS795 TaxID=3034231 RepID=UPI0033951240